MLLITIGTSIPQCEDVRIKKVSMRMCQRERETAYKHHTSIVVLNNVVNVRVRVPPVWSGGQVNER